MNEITEETLMDKVRRGLKDNRAEIEALESLIEEARE